MTPELFSALIITLMLPINAVIAGTANAFSAGFAWGLGNRDTRPDLPPWTERLNRAHKNLLENAPSFIGLVLIAQTLEVRDEITAIGAWTFLIAWILFYIVYAFGVTLFAVRTVSYFVSLMGLTAIAVQIFRSI